MTWESECVDAVVDDDVDDDIDEDDGDVVIPRDSLDKMLEIALANCLASISLPDLMRCK